MERKFRKASSMKQTWNQKLGLLGIVSLLSYTAAVLFAPLAYPGYDWLSQAVSDLSADSAPSRVLWNQLAALYMPCGIVCCTICCLELKSQKNRALRCGILLFTLMNWLSAVGYAMFPLPQSGKPTGFQGVMHLIVTALVVLLSIGSLVLIIYGGWRQKACSFLGRWAAVALGMMLFGAVGTGAFPAAYFGIPERFSVFAAAGFVAILGIALYNGTVCGNKERSA